MTKKLHIMLMMFTILTIGCASVGTRQKWEPEILNEEGSVEEKAKWINIERYICKGASCEVDFKEQKMKGGKVFDFSGLQFKNQ